MDVFVDRRDFQYCAMDIDSAYMALYAASLEEVIKPEMQQRYHLTLKKYHPCSTTQYIYTHTILYENKRGR